MKHQVVILSVKKDKLPGAKVGAVTRFKYSVYRLVLVVTFHLVDGWGGRGGRMDTFLK